VQWIQCASGPETPSAGDVQVFIQPGPRARGFGFSGLGTHRTWKDQSALVPPTPFPVIIRLVSLAATRSTFPPPTPLPPHLLHTSHPASCPSTERRPSTVAVCIAPNAPVLNLERLLCSLSSLLCPACRGLSAQRWDLLHPNVTTCLLRLPSREHLLASSAYLGSSFCRSTYGEVAPPNHILHRFLPVAPDCLVSRLCTTLHLKWLSTSDNAHNPTCTAIGQQSSLPTSTALTSI
jgi:hypothetical protein